MKTIYIWGLLLTIPVMMYGKVKYVYSNFPNEFEIVDVNHSDTTTSISFCCHMMPGEVLSLPSSYCMIDAKGKKYDLLRCEGVRLGERNTCSLSEKIDFSLVFPATDSDTDFLDVVSLTTSNSAPYSVWGICNNNSNTEFLYNVNKGRNEIDNTWFKKGHVLIKGKVIGNRTYDNIHRASVEAYPFTFGATGVYRSDIAADKTFEIDMTVEGPLWTNIELDHRCSVPVFLIPNDSLNLEIFIDDNNNVNVTRISQCNMPTMQGLMEIGLNFTPWEVYREVNSRKPSEYYELAESCLSKYNTLATYLAWKYHLSRAESHLLRVSFNSLLFGCLINHFSSITHKLFPAKGMSSEKDSWKKWANSQELKRAYSFLRLADFSDLSYFVVPYFLQELRSSDILSRLIHGESVQDGFGRLENIIGQKIDIEWRMRMFPK